jgi:mono/diheme cytochrome c family protein
MFFALSLRMGSAAANFAMVRVIGRYAIIVGRSRSRTMLCRVLNLQCLFRLAIASLVLIGLPLIAFAGDAGQGEIIVKRWCAACHLVSADQTQANSDAPSFAAIAHKKKSSKVLSAFLTDPHPKMPDMNLTRSEIANIVAYIGTLDR